MSRTSFAADAVTGGFEDPVHDAQRVFRAVMDAFARPGTIADLGPVVTVPEGIEPAAAALLATLADADAAVYLEERDEATAAWIAFQTDAPVVSDPADAVFALLARGSDPAVRAALPIGTDTYPDRSATLIVTVAALEGGAPLRLEGPGIQTSRAVAPLGLPEGFLAARRANAALFPRGHDHVLVAGTRLLALPRTTRITEA
ncbi:phosphonate C-P lyase system protein PhnH [Aureimonas jatrophae]|uniref:Alpha-D-ribose 1-methylphosphonate 5-triphosphate synthase subunit PhnH n=1 Tax=Aureimonas jatrophae TaxID=1166073 RepID=A0A1H0C7I3_9HYPH|nr:phosphonate C-P lyase system protein PhnH [Aureimonas jatrophae]MBB3949103.1 alpha-D-ribose 1-methylphosphonate 5-triphosphate synthase subunit PhnH [Aureimonas jatrophae]SDN53827.1 alpha-D-ribose 1-methylphosphonate 5-triphosphate synthase subunit PhnH [Aureimonas jatrophae]